jgi:lipopolysaccharide export LptBFGC system permease protein LptF
MEQWFEIFSIISLSHFFSDTGSSLWRVTRAAAVVAIVFTGVLGIMGESGGDQASNIARTTVHKEFQPTKSSKLFSDVSHRNL